jgi:hypothetical protein
VLALAAVLVVGNDIRICTGLGIRLGANHCSHEIAVDGTNSGNN